MSGPAGEPAPFDAPAEPERGGYFSEYEAADDAADAASLGRLLLHSGRMIVVYVKDVVKELKRASAGATEAFSFLILCSDFYTTRQGDFGKSSYCATLLRPSHLFLFYGNTTITTITITKRH